MSGRKKKYFENYSFEKNLIVIYCQNINGLGSLWLDSMKLFFFFLFNEKIIIFFLYMNFLATKYILRFSDSWHSVGSCTRTLCLSALCNKLSQLCNWNFSGDLEAGIRLWPGTIFQPVLSFFFLGADSYLLLIIMETHI